MSPRVVIAGGYGLVGGLVARHLRAAGHELDLVLAGRNPDQGASLAAELGARITYACGADQCRLFGIGASATMDRPAAIQAWARAARRQIAKIGGA